jgi:hypothetical protein
LFIAETNYIDLKDYAAGQSIGRSIDEKNVPDTLQLSANAGSCYARFQRVFMRLFITEIIT